MQTKMAKMAAALTTVMFLALGTASAAGAQDYEAIGEQAGVDGRFLEHSTDADIEAGITAINEQGMVFIWLDSDADPELVADLAMPGVRSASGGRYVAVAALTQLGLITYSDSIDAAPAGDAAFDEFRRGQIADGLQTMATVLAQQGGAEDVNSSSTTNSSGSGNLWAWLLGILAAVAAVFGFTRFRRSRAEKARAEQELQQDKAEITEQLRSNADRVIELGDRAIDSGDPELQRIYEEASTSYQEVSRSLQQANDASTVDQLDERLDHAEWQFEVIEARLDGRPQPPSPSELAKTAAASAPAGSTAGSPSDGPALGPNESIVGGSTPQYRAPVVVPARRRGGGLGMLGPLIYGSTMNRSRRSQRRSPSYRGSTSSRSRSRSRRSSRGGGRFRSSGRKGGGRF